MVKIASTLAKFRSSTPKDEDHEFSSCFTLLQLKLRTEQFNPKEQFNPCINGGEMTMVPRVGHYRTLDLRIWHCENTVRMWVVHSNSSEPSCILIVTAPSENPIGRSEKKRILKHVFFKKNVRFLSSRGLVN